MGDHCQNISIISRLGQNITSRFGFHESVLMFTNRVLLVLHTPKITTSKLQVEVAVWNTVCLNSTTLQIICQVKNESNSSIYLSWANLTFMLPNGLRPSKLHLNIDLDSLSCLKNKYIVCRFFSNYFILFIIFQTVFLLLKNENSTIVRDSKGLNIYQVFCFDLLNSDKKHFILYDFNSYARILISRYYFEIMAPNSLFDFAQGLATGLNTTTMVRKRRDVVDLICESSCRRIFDTITFKRLKYFSNNFLYDNCINECEWTIKILTVKIFFFSN